MLPYYQFSNLVLKHGPLINALADSVKCLLKIMVLLKFVQNNIGIHNSHSLYDYIQPKTIVFDQRVIIADKCDKSLFRLTATAS